MGLPLAHGSVQGVCDVRNSRAQCLGHKSKKITSSLKKNQKLRGYSGNTRSIWKPHDGFRGSPIGRLHSVFVEWKRSRRGVGACVVAAAATAAAAAAAAIVSRP